MIRINYSDMEWKVCNKNLFNEVEKIYVMKISYSDVEGKFIDKVQLF